MPTSSHTYPTKEAPWVAAVRQVVKAWLQTCNLQYPTIAHDDDFHNLCYSVAIREGYPFHDSGSLSVYLSPGVNMAMTAYGHLPDTNTRVWIALYTAFMTASDDLFAENVAPAQAFFRRMLLGQPQHQPALDGLAAKLTEMSQYFDAIQDAIILTSTLNFITSLSVEHVVSGVDLPSCAERYAMWSGMLSGANDAYAMFAFPREVPFQAYAHAIPDMMTFIRTANDILSFYKEEMAGETVNHVSLVAQSRNISKLDALQVVADECTAAYLRVNETLLCDSAAHASWVSFAAGLVGFHTASKRYRLDELHVDV